MVKKKLKCLNISYSLICTLNVYYLLFIIIEALSCSYNFPSPDTSVPMASNVRGAVNAITVRERIPNASPTGTQTVYVPPASIYMLIDASHVKIVVTASSKLENANQIKTGSVKLVNQ